MEWFASPYIIPLAVFAIPIVAIVGHYWYHLVKVRSENELKRSMVERGMSASEIDRVLKASSEPADVEENCAS